MGASSVSVGGKSRRPTAQPAAFGRPESTPATSGTGGTTNLHNTSLLPQSGQIGYFAPIIEITDVWVSTTGKDDQEVGEVIFRARVALTPWQRGRAIFHPAAEVCAALCARRRELVGATGFEPVTSTV